MLLPPLVVDDQVPQHPEQPASEADHVFRQGQPRPVKRLLHHVLRQMAAPAQGLGIQQRRGVIFLIELLEYIPIHGLFTTFCI